LAAFGIAILFTPLLIINIRPPFDFDSVAGLTSLLSWVHNQVTPYSYVWFNSYPAFWELGYLPGMVITHSDQFLWKYSLQAVLLAALAVACIARRIGMQQSQVVIGLLVFFGSTGHFYLRNLLAYQNPVYPMAIRFAGSTIFPGAEVLVGTTILDNLTNPQLLAIAQDSGKLAGILFPWIVAASLIAAVVVLVLRLGMLLRRRNQPDRPQHAVEMALAWLVLISWFLYSSTFRSAGNALWES
jgi:hypothetical protein